MSATARARVRQALERAGIRGCTTAELCQPDVGGERFGARLMELRAEGAHITSAPIRKGSWRYTLTDAEASAGEDPAATSAVPPSRTAVVQPERAAVTRPGVRLGIGPIVPFHACDSCGYKWRDAADWWPDKCPSCNAGVHWISSFRFRHQAQDHVPLCQIEPVDFPAAA